jgi:predicted deacylase
VITNIDVSELKGRIKAIPVVNPLAFEAITRNTPLDMLNLNRVVPGNRAGWLTEKLAAVIREEYLPGIDYLIDLHAGGHHGWVDYLIMEDRDASLASGSDYIYLGPGPKGSLKDAAKGAGVRAWSTFEFGGIDCKSGPMVEKGVRCTLNLMKYWGMLPGNLELPPRQYIMHEKTVLRSTHGGLLYHDWEHAAIGRQVPKGTVLGRVVSPYTFEILEEIRAPYEQNIVFHIRAHDGLLHPGDYVFQCGDMNQTEIVENG